MKKIVLTLAASLIALSAVAQKVVVYPKTGEAIEISAKKTVAFKPGKNLLEDIR